ncbi:FliH/SctL family protein [Allosphingosinicella indica]|uniref:Flagellar assembly protein FliH n=1 Tax=Allosphingosinicella indica TaxID=941907 RepID=A0A1X7GPC0_9SPHN|nr:FliH/SctL family protein [Allosphingosinicella indica]SMF72617.1 flagellar assembly protein FliH [Allosphingosinicella indica]
MSNLWTGEFSRSAESLGSFAVHRAMPMFTPWGQGSGDDDAQGERPRSTDVEAIRAEAFAEGYEAGHRTAELTLAADKEALAKLLEAVEALRPEPTDALAALLAEAVERLVHQIVGTVEIDAALLRERAEMAAAMIGEDNDASRLMVHPDDVPLLEGAPIPVEIVGDPSLPRGTVRLETGSGWIEDGPAIRLDRLRTALGKMGAGE